MPARFDDLEIGTVTYLGVAVVDAAALQAFIDAFAPGWNLEDGAPDGMTFAIWAKLDLLRPPSGRKPSGWVSTRCAGCAIPRSAKCSAAG